MNRSVKLFQEYMVIVKAAKKTRDAAIRTAEKNYEEATAFARFTLHNKLNPEVPQG